MKRALFLLPVLALLLAVPAVSQDAGRDDLAGDVEKLEKLVAAQQKTLQELQTYVGVLKGEAATLRKALAKAETDGFTLPAPNNSAKKALLQGLQRWAHVAATGKAPTEASAED